MSKVRLTLNILAVVIFTMTVSSLASAQATRTWVSGVGDDANPCSRTAPCKTFAGAISKTAAAGEISVLDPGGFGTITITKSITINGTHGAGYGSISAALTTGVIVNNAAAIVKLTSLNINGMGNGVDGIRINAAASVYIEDTTIGGFTNRGINDIRTTANGKLFITDSTVRDTAQSGIVMLPGVGGSITGMIDNTRVEGAGNTGVVYDLNTKGIIKNSFIVGNATGFVSEGTAADATIDNCVISNNTTGLAPVAPGIVRLLNSTITGNGTSITVGGQPQVQSNGNNIISGNGANNLPTGTPISFN